MNGLKHRSHFWYVYFELFWVVVWHLFRSTLSLWNTNVCYDCCRV